MLGSLKKKEKKRHQTIWETIYATFLTFFKTDRIVFTHLFKTLLLNNKNIVSTVIEISEVWIVTNSNFLL